MIDHINPDLFYLPHLKYLFLRNNELSNVADKLQFKNSDMWILDITRNAIKVHRGFYFGRNITHILSDFGEECCHAFSKKQCTGMNCLKLINKKYVYLIAWIDAFGSLVVILFSFAMSLINESSNVHSTNTIRGILVTVKFWSAVQTQNMLTNISSLLYVCILIFSQMSIWRKFH